jgi:hypothetical protein
VHGGGDDRRGDVSGWRTVYRYVAPIDPDYGGAPTKVTVWLDNLGGIVLGIDHGDGRKVAVVPLPPDAAEDIAAALHARETQDES